MWPHVQPLIDLGILVLDERQALISTEGANGRVVDSFMEELESLSALEETFSKFRFFEVIARQLSTTRSPFDMKTSQVSTRSLSGRRLRVDEERDNGHCVC